ncbi:MAG: hypothetical protein V4805_01545 [Pseudomonadota bacterium]
MTNATFDANIPLLTEVIVAPAPSLPSAAAPSAPSFGSASGSSGSSRTDGLVQKAANAWTVAEWELIERTLRERILRNVQDRIDSELEHRVRDSLADVLQIAVEGLAAEIKRGLNDTLEEVIARAVKQEISLLQENKK